MCHVPTVCDPLCQVEDAALEAQSGESEVAELRRHIACLQHQLSEARDVIASQHKVMTAAVLLQQPVAT